MFCFTSWCWHFNRFPSFTRTAQNAESMGKTFKSSCLNGCFSKCSSTVQTRLFLCKFSEELYFWMTTFEIYHIIFVVFLISRSSYRRCSVKKAVLKNFTIFTGNYLCRGLFLIRFHGAIWKSRHWHRHRHRHSNINIVFYTVQIAFRVKS